MRRIRRDENQEQDFELNIASIIDCFTVLIAYLLLSTSFISLGIFDVGVAAPAEASVGNSELTVSVTVQIGTDKTLLLHTNGDEEKSYTVAPKADGTADYESAARIFKGLKDRHPQVNEVTVTGADKVHYRDVVRTVQEFRKLTKKVYLGES